MVKGYIDSNVETAPYLRLVYERDLYQAIARLKLRSHRLMVETGGWRGVPYRRRRCPCCLVTEDEEHFLFECDLYNHLRQNHIPEQLYMTGGDDSMRALLNSDDEKVLNNLGRYIRKSFATRDKFVAENETPTIT